MACSADERVTHLIRNPKHVQGFSHRHDPRSGPYGAFNDVLEEIWRASVWCRGVADVVRCNDEPSARDSVVFNQALDVVGIVPGLFEKVCAQVIEIGLSDVEGLPSA